jgi:excisionase family DNA binding protein
MATETRVDSSSLSPEDRGRLPHLAGAIEADCPFLVVGNEKVAVPEPVARFMASVIRDLSNGKSVVVIPEDETFTTQAAAEVLGMSRQFLVRLLDNGEIPFHRVGTHRRVTYKDLMKYKRKRDASRRKTLDKAFDEINSAGLYDSSSSYTGRADAGR